MCYVTSREAVIARLGCFGSDLTYKFEHSMFNVKGSILPKGVYDLLPAFSGLSHALKMG